MTTDTYHYRGYEIVATRQWANWCASIYTTRSDLPLVARSTLRTLAQRKEGAVAEAKQKIDRLLAREVNMMDKDKEGVLGTIAETAKTGMDAAIEGVSSAATSIAQAVTGTTERPRRQRKTTKKAAASPRRTTTRRAKAKRTGTRRARSAAATRRSTGKTAASKPTRRGAQARRSTTKSRKPRRSAKSRSR